MIKAEIIADSLSPFGNRLTTFVLTFPRIVLAEFNTHRAFSRNSASSRAIPFKKMVELVEKDPFIPIAWQKDHNGMQGTEYWTEKDFIGADGYDSREYDYASVVDEMTDMWLEARDEAVYYAKGLSENGLTKQLCNRMLEPYMWHTVIVTASEWENFFALRSHPDAEIHIAKLAELMLEEYNKSTPKNLKEEEWHIPFGDKFDEKRLIQLLTEEEIAHINSVPVKEGNPKLTARIKEYRTQKALSLHKVKIATARCARVSYLNFEGKDDYGADIALYDRLLKSGHMSPFEHCARVMTEFEYTTDQETHNLLGESLQGWSGNFRGFIQHRKMISGENKTDSRVIKK